eukprot:CAMPEP_0202957494 /NCGR_PEP_ID=MMETSP1396-20130829/1865_1 /ASSEMBLY_ACC=CAM_ASM_000872 /TAXON_ID= /ORGANISM="Pseudokeronopsis sp., Strain Brazil" /LENGTH=362 /DNA_ID=CAMNT_0049674987 /DNA_START=87 /DNA_END=1175 /DNA_ORIENTATION=-
MTPVQCQWQAIPPDVWGVVQNTNFFTVRQHTKLFPKNCCACPPCVKQENTYSVYAGLNQDQQNEFLRVDEVSDDWNRCCCAPYHPVKLEVRPFVPTPGSGGNTSDFSHIRQDLASSWGSMDVRSRSTAIKDLYMQYPPLATMIRHDGQRCCFPVRSPCRWLSTFVCFACCQDGMDVYAGSLQDDPEGEKGRPYQLANHQDRLIGSVVQPIYGGCYRPELHLSTADASEPFARMTGPCFFGGWSECCCTYPFPLTSFNNTNKDAEGDLGVVSKIKPKSFAGAMRELFSEADVYSLAFGTANGGLTPAQKITTLASQLLLDYMIFEGNTEKCSEDNDAYYCYCCYFMCIGKLCPVYIAIPKNKN